MDKCSCCEGSKDARRRVDNARWNCLARKQHTGSSRNNSVLTILNPGNLGNQILPARRASFYLLVISVQRMAGGFESVLRARKVHTRKEVHMGTEGDIESPTKADTAAASQERRELPIVDPKMEGGDDNISKAGDLTKTPTDSTDHTVKNSVQKWLRAAVNKVVPKKTRIVVFPREPRDLVINDDEMNWSAAKPNSKFDVDFRDWTSSDPKKGELISHLRSRDEVYVRGHDCPRRSYLNGFIVGIVCFLCGMGTMLLTVKQLPSQVADNPTWQITVGFSMITVTILGAISWLCLLFPRFLKRGI